MVHSIKGYVKIKEIGSLALIAASYYVVVVHFFPRMWCTFFGLTLAACCAELSIRNEMHGSTTFRPLSGFGAGNSRNMTLD